MSDSEDTAQLLGSKPSDFRNSLILNTDNVKPTESVPSTKKNNNLFVLNGRKHVFEAFTPIQSYVGASVAVLAGLSFGFDMTIGTNLLLSLGSILDLNCFEHRMLINGWIAGAIIATLFGGLIMDKCGRRGTMLGSSLILSISSLLGVMSGTYLIPFIPRFLSGCSVCSLLMSQCVYITETCRSERRARTVVFQQIALQIGILFSAMVGIQNATTQNNQFFHMVTGMICAFGISIFIVTYFFLPESPHFIISREAGLNPTELLYKNGETLGRNGVVWALTRSIGLVVLTQLSGRTWVLSYAPRLFSLVGICFSVADSTVALTTSIIRILTASLLWYIVTRLGLRNCILISVSIMAFSMAFLSTIAGFDLKHNSSLSPGPRVCNVMPIYGSIGMLPLAHDKEPNFQANDNIEGSIRPPFPLLPTPVALLDYPPQERMENPLKCPRDDLPPPSGLIHSLRVCGVVIVLLYEAAYTLGFGSLGWLLVCEIFPTAWRARGLGISVGLYFAMDLIVQMTFLKIPLQLYGMMVMFSMFGWISVFVFYMILPDTRRKSLTQIQTNTHERQGERMWKIVKFLTKCENKEEAGQAHI